VARRPSECGAAEKTGYPLIVKPIDGAGSGHLPAGSAPSWTRSCQRAHLPRVSVEEFIDGQEFTYDTICAGGQVLFENICQYHPRPLMTKCTSG